MKIRLQLAASVAASVFTLFAVSAHADNMQQSKMKSCNADATTQKLTGADRKAYMKTCLSAAPAATTATTATKTNSQQAKMKSCNADATTQKLTGADRKAYMKTCLSGSASAAAPATAPVPTSKP
jgi:psiF repeat